MQTIVAENPVLFVDSYEASACLQIGGISVSLPVVFPDDTFIPREFAQFESLRNIPDIEVKVNWCDALMPSSEKPLFDSGAVWRLFREAGDLVFDFTTPALGPAPYKQMRVDNGFRQVEITLSSNLLAERTPIYPLEYPTDELLITNFLSSGIGVEVHGCGVIDREGRGYLFLGHSGAGKSTTARLWHSLRKAEVLSDDRIILRLHDGELWMYGTPWHGEGAFASANKAKVSGLFVLQHGNDNRFASLSNARSVGELFARCFPPFHSANALERTVEFLQRALTAVPAHEFRFTPDSRAIKAVLGFHD
ncbi:MAG TPA: hypothetical protein VGU90_06105 [Terriglobales bacterium]|nr:hypothetical protein [Terriglobales bacterium]